VTVGGRCAAIFRVITRSDVVSYANVLTLDGRRDGHLLDPRTLRPADASLSATVWARDGTLADAASTAAFVLGPVKGLAFIRSMPGMAAVIAYREPGGGVGLAISPDLQRSFHPVDRPGP
jgi:thiamine biosynthesis lipoprotein ApbE